MNEDINNDKDYQIIKLKQRISYYEPYKQKYEDLKEDCKYIKSLLDKEFNEKTRLKKENEQLKSQKKVFELCLDLNDLDIEGDEFCSVEQCVFDNPSFHCQNCIFWIGHQK